jgi:hypothetical protein
LHPDGDKRCKIVLNSVEVTEQQITGTYRFAAACRQDNTGTITIQPIAQPSRSCADTTSVQYTIPANVAWWDSNFEVTPGENISIGVNSSDTWTISGPQRGNYPWVNADGWSWEALEALDPSIETNRDEFADPEQVPAALLYKIGADGAPLLLGTAGLQNFAVGQTGTVFFSANDDPRTPPATLGFTDNVGSIRVQVTCDP